MFCPHCGFSLGNDQANFCSYCGNRTNNTPLVRQEYAPKGSNDPIVQDGGNGRPDNKKIIVIFLVLAFIFVIFFNVVVSENDESEYGEKHIQIVTTDTHFELSGDFLPEKNIFTVSLTDEGRIAFALNDNISSQYNYYSWTLYDIDHVSSTNTHFYSEYVGETINKTEPTLYYHNNDIGEYNVSVKCYIKSNEQYVYSTTYSGTVSYVGTITEDYEWIYHGIQYSAEVSFNYDEYRSYRMMDHNSRWVTDYNKTTQFITYDDPVVVALAESLREAYDIEHDASDQSFAEFVLGFVQICFDYPPHSNSMEADKYLYGQDEYFAYPLETIFFRMGDCEDTSILAAALFKALGYEAGIIVVPGHAVAAVGLDAFTPGSYQASQYEILSKTINGTTYYACETTIKTHLGVGLISSSGINGKHYSEFIGKDKYGFYLA